MMFITVIVCGVLLLGCQPNTEVQKSTAVGSKLDNLMRIVVHPLWSMSITYLILILLSNSGNQTDELRLASSIIKAIKNETP